MLTDPEQAADFVRARPGWMRWRSPSAPVHGAYKFSRKPTGDILAIERIKEIHARVPNTHLVMHGTSSRAAGVAGRSFAARWKIKETYGVPVEEIQHGIRHGVRKVNIDTDIRLAMTGAMRQLMAKPSEFDPRKFLKRGEGGRRGDLQLRFEAFGSAGMASRIKSIPLDAMADSYARGALRAVVH